MKKRTLLITNDDGITSPGLCALYEAVKHDFDVIIAAPSKQRSGTGIGLTLHRPIHIHPHQWIDPCPAWKIDGKPADCIKLACSILLKKLPDMVLSGINPGSNAGRNALYSGTVGGAMEATIRGIPGIAFSCVNEINPDYEGAKRFITPIIHHFFNHPLPKGTLINVNFPDSAYLGIKYARQGLSYILENPYQCKETKGYYISKKWDLHPEHEESDTTYLKQGYITATPIHINEMTDIDHYTTHKKHFESLDITD